MQPERLIETLGPAFYDPVEPARFPTHAIRFRNDAWARRVGLDGLGDDAWIDHFGRFAPLPGSLPQPLALRYHGHQFRAYNPDLGDGRGFLHAQLRDLTDNRLLDLGTKGSGQTPWSRFGDGRLTLKGGVREVLATEMLEALGVYTSKSFSLIETGEQLVRQDEPSPTRSSVLVRLGHSHIRFGTFQRLAFHKQAADMETLVTYCLVHLLDAPDAMASSLEARVGLFLDRVADRAARLVGQYMAAGFVHGVLNTDNLNVTGESFDYGPWRFAPTYDLGFVAAYFDHGGLYAFGRQVEAFHWNLYQLAGALLLLVDKAVVLPALESFPRRFEEALIAAIFRRLGILPAFDARMDVGLIGTIEAALVKTGLGLDRFYFDWYGGTLSAARAAQAPDAAVYASEAFAAFREAIAAFAPDPAAPARLASPYFSGGEPCAMLIDEVEAIWDDIASHDDWTRFHAKIAAIRAMGAVLNTTAS